MKEFIARCAAATACAALCANVASAQVAQTPEAPVEAPRHHEEWTVGLSNQNRFTADSARAPFQPTLGQDVADWFTLSLGELEIEYDYDAGPLENLPVGLQLNVVPTIFDQPVRFEGGGHWNIKDEPGTPRFTLTLGISFSIRAEMPHR